MAHYVKISCLSAEQCRIDAGAGFDESVNRLIAHWERQLEQVLPDRPDLIVLPEMCDTPGGIGAASDWLLDYYRHRGNAVRDFFGRVAAEYRCCIAYSAIVHIPEEDSFRNATQWIGRSGRVEGTYDKNFLTVNENAIPAMIHGREAAVLETDLGRVACVICYDLNFDELRQRYIEQKPDLIVFSSAYHGGLMQQYWAYSCQAHFAGSVWTGNPCSIVSPVGHTIAESTNYYPYVTRTINLDCAVIHIGPNGRRFAEIKRKYGSRVNIHDPGRLGSVLLSSETDEFTVNDIVEEFGLQRLDGKWAGARADRSNRLEGRGGSV